MNWTWHWPECPDGPLLRNDTVVVFKVNDLWGSLSNMSNDYPLLVNGIQFGSSEALYQACRFPHQPEWQEEIINAPHAMMAKMAAKKAGRRRHHSRPDFDTVKVEIMRWCLQIKLAQHLDTFGDVLQSTGTSALVERSRSDNFWGARVVKDREYMLCGANTLGRLLMEFREQFNSNDRNSLLVVHPPRIGNFLLLGRPIQRLDFRPSVTFMATAKKLTREQIRSLETILLNPQRAAIQRLTEVRHAGLNGCVSQFIDVCKCRQVPTIEVHDNDRESCVRQLIVSANTLIVALHCNDVTTVPDDLPNRTVDSARQAGNNIVFLYPDGEWDVEMDD